MFVTEYLYHLERPPVLLSKVRDEWLLDLSWSATPTSPSPVVSGSCNFGIYDVLLGLPARDSTVVSELQVADNRPVLRRAPDQPLASPLCFPHLSGIAWRILLPLWPLIAARLPGSSVRRLPARSSASILTGTRDLRSRSAGGWVTGHDTSGRNMPGRSGLSLSVSPLLRPYTRLRVRHNG